MSAFRDAADAAFFAFFALAALVFAVGTRDRVTLTGRAPPASTAARAWAWRSASGSPS